MDSGIPIPEPHFRRVSGIGIPDTNTPSTQFLKEPGKLGELMNQKRRILIVDDEESVLTVLKSSLKKLGEDYEVQAVNNGLKALQLLESFAFDVVVTDYQMDQMNGLELLEAIRSIQPETKVIMITAYGTDELEAEARRMQAYEYLTKPLEIDSFRQVVLAALDDMAFSRPGILILSEKRYREAVDLLEQLIMDVGGRCLMLADAGGRVIARVGDADNLSLEQIVPLLGGGISTLIEVGRTLDGNTDAINLTYREGERENLYIVNVGRQILLILVVDRTAYSSRLGSVWYHARQTAVNLRQTVGDMDFASAPQDFLKDNLSNAFEDELDKLFSSD